VDYLANNLSV